jgi:hypothetical protein
MQVVIPKSKLEAEKACADYFDSPEWNGEALVYADWGQTVERLLSTRRGVLQLSWLVSHKLVPMTLEEFAAARKARPELERTVPRGR